MAITSPVFKLICVVQAGVFYYFMRNNDMKKPRDQPVEFEPLFSTKSKQMDLFSKEQMGDLPLEELEKNIAELKNRRGMK